MKVDETTELLRQFARERSEGAFRELVRRHSPVVYGAALRMSGGDRAAAQDVTQEVFTLLARKAGGLGGVTLSAWLYRQACRRAANHVRSEVRRKRRELVAAEMMASSSDAEFQSAEGLEGAVDTALLTLPATDRDALVLRYFEGRDYRSLGGELGTSEEAARKRVNRAIEKLAGALRKQGIALGTASLTTTMSTFGATPLPEGLVSQVSFHALKAAPAGGATGIASWLKPLLAGVTLTSLAAGGTIAAQANRPVLVPHPKAPSVAPERSTAWVKPVPVDASLDDLIQEIKRAHAGPQHALTTLRIGAILEGIGIGEIPRFILLAHDKLTPVEQEACFRPLLERWLKVDPTAAMDFVLHDFPAPDGSLGQRTELLGRLFGEWTAADLGTARAWLLSNWEVPGMTEVFVMYPLRLQLSVKVVDKVLYQGGGEAAIGFARQLPGDAGRKLVMHAIAGSDPYSSACMNLPMEEVLALYRALLAMPEKDLGRDTAALLWKNLKEERVEGLAGMEETMSPSERFEASLAMLLVRRTATVREPTPGGGYIQRSEPVDGIAVGRDAAIEAGLAIGMERSEIVSVMTELVMNNMPHEQALAWVDKHRDEVDLDALLIRKVSKSDEGDDSGYVLGFSPERQMIDWASRMRDPDLRLRICRGAFLRMSLRSEDEVKRCLEAPGMPDDLRIELQKLSAAKP